MSNQLANLSSHLLFHKATTAIDHSSYRVVCPKVGHTALTSSYLVYALSCCRHNMKIINHHSKAETISKLTVHSQLLQN